MEASESGCGPPTEDAAHRSGRPPPVMYLRVLPERVRENLANLFDCTNTL